MLSEAAGRRVELLTPRRGAKADLIRLANKNAVEEVERATSRSERQSKLLELLGRLLDLEKPPQRIESYDISNQGASDIVASMVVYARGQAPQAGLPALQAQEHGRPRRSRLHGAGAHPALPAVSGRGREVFRPPRRPLHRRRRGARPGGGGCGREAGGFPSRCSAW